MCYYILKLITNIERISIAGIVSISIWILFQHNFLKSELGPILLKIKLNNLASELALILIIILIYLSFLLIIKKNIFKRFIFFFLMFNFFYSSYIFSLNIISLQSFVTKVIEIQNKNILTTSKKRPNIYFFILDAMKPLNEFEKFYDINLLNFKKKYDRYNYIYFTDTKNLYGDTTYELSALFNLENIFIEEGNYNENTNLKSNIKKFPSILRKQNNSKLINDLKNLGYQFKWIGNIFANCSKYNYNYCLQDKKKIQLDYYLLNAFLSKTPFPQIYNIILSPEIFQKNFGIYVKNNAINKLEKHLLSNNIYKKDAQTFYFVHHMHPHWPYKFDENCNYKNFPGNLNFEGYKNSYICVTKQISNLIDLIEKVDSEAMVIFQSDHNWEMSKNSEEKYGNRKQIFSLIKNNIKCNKPIPNGLNNLGITKYLLNCLKN